MASSDLNAQTNGIIVNAQNLANAALARDDYAEAKRALTDGLRELRDYKRQLTEAERSIRAQAQDARLKNRASGQTVGLFMGSKGRGALARGRAAGGRSIANQQQQMLAPYASAKVNVDRAIAQLDRAKAQVTNDAAATREPGASSPAKPTLPPPPPPTPAAWAADPSGRHEHRYWDGTAWTDHVADRGVSGTDPM